MDPQLKDFRNFLYLVWKHLRLPDPTPVQYDIASYLQHGPRRRIVKAFRGVGKSWITAAYALWQLLKNPQIKIEVVSASKSLANDFSTFCFQLLNSMELLSHLKPPDHSKIKRSSKLEFDVLPALESKDPSVKSVGITGQVTGTRADIIIADDIETPNNTATQEARDKLSEAVREFDAIGKPNFDCIYLGTPHTEQSLYNVLTDRGYDKRVWPARYPSEKLIDAYDGRLAPFLSKQWTAELVGQPTDPERFDDIDLLEREADGKTWFQLQYMLDTTLADSDRYPLKLSDLIVMDLDSETAPEKLVWARELSLEWSSDIISCVGLRGDRYYRPFKAMGDHIPYTGSVMSIDPAGRGKDETGYAVVKMLNGFLYVPEAGGLMGGYDENTLLELKRVLIRNRVNELIIESNFGDGMFMALLKPILTAVQFQGTADEIPRYSVTIEEVRHHTQKESRIIDTLEPVLNRHRLVVDPKVIQKDQESTKGYHKEHQLYYQLFWQMSRLTSDRGSLRQDDRLDALSQGVAYWIDRISQDEDHQMASRKERILDKELRSFMDTALGQVPRRPSFITSNIGVHRNIN